MRRSATALLLVALAGCSLWSCSSQRDRPKGQVPYGFMGMLAGPPLAGAGFSGTDAQVREMARSGVESLRFPFYWRDAQPSAHGPVDFSSFDRLVAACARARIALLPSVFGVPRWARRRQAEQGSPPADPASYARFLGVLVRRYGARGTFWAGHPELPRRPVRDWQVWNEPDRAEYWADQPYYRGYVRVLAAARREVKAADPGARVVLAGLVGRSWVQLRELYRAGARPYFDVMAVHPFTLRLRNVMRILDYVRAEMRRAGDQAKPMLVTELAWPTSLGRLNTPSDFDITERQQALLLRGAYRMLARDRGRLRLERAYWATWLSSDRSRTDAFDYAGLSTLLPSGKIRHKPAFFAYRDVARRLEGCAKSDQATRCD